MVVLLIAALASFVSLLVDYFNYRVNEANKSIVCVEAEVKTADRPGFITFITLNRWDFTNAEFVDEHFDGTLDKVKTFKDGKWNEISKNSVPAAEWKIWEERFQNIRREAAYGPMPSGKK